ncbi:hypothetical protein Pelo_11899 [Pelomyxa schiedti]|nr:hypothetical protein Pelo_11899 [Pelomyxa schiedti]
MRGATAKFEGFKLSNNVCGPIGVMQTGDHAALCSMLLQPTITPAPTPTAPPTTTTTTTSTTATGSSRVNGSVKSQSCARVTSQMQHNAVQVGKGTSRGAAVGCCCYYVDANMCVIRAVLAPCGGGTTGVSGTSCAATSVTGSATGNAGASVCVTGDGNQINCTLEHLFTMPKPTLTATSMDACVLTVVGEDNLFIASDGCGSLFIAEGNSSYKITTLQPLAGIEFVIIDVVRTTDGALLILLYSVHDSLFESQTLGNEINTPSTTKEPTNTTETSSPDQLACPTEKRARIDFKPAHSTTESSLEGQPSTSHAPSTQHFRSGFKLHLLRVSRKEDNEFIISGLTSLWSFSPLVHAQLSSLGSLLAVISETPYQDGSVKVPDDTMEKTNMEDEDEDEGERDDYEDDDDEFDTVLNKGCSSEKVMYVNCYAVDFSTTSGSLILSGDPLCVGEVYNVTPDVDSFVVLCKNGKDVNVVKYEFDETNMTVTALDIATFPVLSYLFNGKPNKRWMLITPDQSHAAVVESQRYVYIYQKPLPLERWAPHQVLQHHTTSSKAEFMGARLFLVGAIKVLLVLTTSEILTWALL